LAEFEKLGRMIMQITNVLDYEDPARHTWIPELDLLWGQQGQTACKDTFIPFDLPTVTWLALQGKQKETVICTLR
jgi:hypothetical protein